MQNIDLDLPDSPQHLHQLHPQGKRMCRKRRTDREADWMTEEKDELTEMLRQLYRMINQLGQLDKSIVLLYLEEKSYEEIAEITGLTVTNVATKLSRIKDKLKKMKKEE